jgi:hypothetical protein
MNKKSQTFLKLISRTPELMRMDSIYSLLFVILEKF